MLKDFFSHFRRSESLFEATKKEQKEAIEKLIEFSNLKSGYHLLIILSTCIVTAGLLINNTPIVIGGMILAPIMIPILLFSLSIVSRNKGGILFSLETLFISVIVVIATAVVITAAVNQNYSDIGTWIPFEVPTEMYLLIAFCSGIAGALAWVKEGLAPSIAGVAVAVSLMPPLCAAGVSFTLEGFKLNQITLNSIHIFGTNVVGIIIAGLIVFWMLGFFRADKIAQEAIEENEESNK